MSCCGESPGINFLATLDVSGVANMPRKYITARIGGFGRPDEQVWRNHKMLSGLAG